MDITETQQQYFEIFYLLCDLNNVIGSKLFTYAVLNVQFLMILLYSVNEAGSIDFQLSVQTV